MVRGLLNSTQLADLLGISRHLVTNALRPERGGEIPVAEQEPGGTRLLDEAGIQVLVPQLAERYGDRMRSGQDLVASWTSLHEAVAEASVAAGDLERDPAECEADVAAAQEDVDKAQQRVDDLRRLVKLKQINLTIAVDLYRDLERLSLWRDGAEAVIRALGYNMAEISHELYPPKAVQEERARRAYEDRQKAKN